MESHHPWWCFVALLSNLLCHWWTMRPMSDSWVTLRRVSSMSDSILGNRWSALTLSDKWCIARPSRHVNWSFLHCCAFMQFCVEHDLSRMHQHKWSATWMEMGLTDDAHCPIFDFCPTPPTCDPFFHVSVDWMLAPFQQIFFCKALSKFFLRKKNAVFWLFHPGLHEIQIWNSRCLGDLFPRDVWVWIVRAACKTHSLSSQQTLLTKFAGHGICFLFPLADSHSCQCKNSDILVCLVCLWCQFCAQGSGGGNRRPLWSMIWKLPCSFLWSVAEAVHCLANVLCMILQFQALQFSRDVQHAHAEQLIVVEVQCENSPCCQGPHQCQAIQMTAKTRDQMLLL